LILPTHNQPYNLSTSTQQQIVDVIHSFELLDWAARVIVQLEPSRFADGVLNALALYVVGKDLL
jgi:hypothetical protein